MDRLIALLFTAVAALAAMPAFAGAMLTVINPTIGPDAMKEFSRSELKELTQTSYRTSTEFTDGLPEFSGPLARDVIASVGVGDATVAVMVAANDYQIEVPIEEPSGAIVRPDTVCPDRSASVRSGRILYVGDG